MAEIYDRVIDNPAENTSDALILQRIRPGSTILECGCATGYMTKYMKERLDATVFVIERNPDAFKKAIRYAAGGVCADLEQTDTWADCFGNTRFDYILFADVLEHLRNPEAVLRKSGELLKEDGEVLASIPNVAHADIQINLLHQRWNYKRFGLLDDTHIHFWGPGNIEKLFYSADLSPVVLDYSILPPFQTEQADKEIQKDELPVIDMICRRSRSDIYQFVVMAKKTERVMTGQLPCEDFYEQRHAAYGAMPDCCTQYEREIDEQNTERKRFDDSFHKLLAAFEKMTEDHTALTKEKYLMLEKYDRLTGEQDKLQAVYNELQSEYDRAAAEHQALQSENESLLAELENVHSERNSEATRLIQENHALRAANQQLEEQLGQSRAAYNVISNAFFWKLTALPRKLTDALKHLLRNSAVAHLIWKGLKCFKQNGLVYTWKKLINYRRKTGDSCEETVETLAIPSFYDPGSPITILTTKHTVFVAKLLENSLKKINIQTNILVGEAESYGEEMHIVICPQMFQHFPGRYVAFQMEQTISSRWLTEKYMDILRHAYAVFDYSLVNIKYFKQHADIGHMFYYLPIDYLPGFQRIAEKQEYDVVFYGDINNPRRRRILSELQKSFEVHVLSEVFGETLYEELSKAKVVLNLHYYEDAMLETTRIYETLSIGSSIVVSERSSDPKEEERLEQIVDFVEPDDIERLKERIAYWLGDEDRRREQVKKNNSMLSGRVSAFDYFFYRFFLANDWLSFDKFYELVGGFVHFEGNRVCLSLPEAVERREAFDRDNHYGFEVFPGLRHKRGWTGCGLSYKFIMKKAQEQALEKILVCEDDVFFPDDFEERFQRCLDYLAKHEEWDIFQGLMADVGNVTVSKVDRENGQVFAHLDHMISTVFNVYSQNVYPDITAWDEKNDNVHTNTIDRSLEAKDLRIVATAPFLVGHKEELNSTVWGFNNSQYSDMIDESSKKLELLIEKFEKKDRR